MTSNLETLILFSSIGYLVGSIPFGLVITYTAGVGDIRKIGSGNIGATNVLRTGRKYLAAFTLILDSGKGALLTLWVATFWTMELATLSGFMAVLGHNFPIWLKFNGGKGVATSIGVLIAIAWPIGLFTCLCWLLAALLFRYSSLAALISLSLTPFFSWWYDSLETLVVSSLLAILSIIRHKNNIKNLLNSRETKIEFKKN